MTSPGCRLTLLALFVAGCGDSRPAAPPTSPSSAPVVDPPDAPRFLALGDSYTIGEGVAPAERWPVQLAVALRAKGVSVADPTIVAKTGWTTDELSAAMDKAGLTGPYNLVSLLIGVNNQYRGRDAEEYRGQFVALLRRAVELAGGRADRVIVVSIPDWGVTPFAKDRDAAAIAAAIDRFNAINKEETDRAGGRYVEITVASRRAKADPALVAADGLHPSGTMYAEWAAAALPAATAALAGDPKPSPGK